MTTEQKQAQKEMLRQWHVDAYRSLTDLERDYLLPMVIRELNCRKTKQAQIKQKDLSAIFKRKGFLLHAQTFRRIIHVIKTGNMMPGLIATKNGYYVTDNKAELGRYFRGITTRTKSQYAIYLAARFQYEDATVTQMDENMLVLLEENAF